jgi:integration host factor subunit beta
MNKLKLIDRFAKENGLTKPEAKKIIELTFQKMSEALADGDRVEIRGLGSFAIKNYKAYKGINPKTGEIIKVARKKLPFFKVGRELKSRVNFK